MPKILETSLCLNCKKIRLFQHISCSNTTESSVVWYKCLMISHSPRAYKTIFLLFEVTLITNKMQVFLLALIVSCSFVARTSATLKHDVSKKIQINFETDANADVESHGNGTSAPGTEVTPTEQTTLCREGWHPFQGKCLYFSEDTSTFDGQINHCYSLDAKPINDLDKETFDYISGVASQANKEFLLTLRKRRGYGQHFRWLFTSSRGWDFYGSTLEAHEGEYADLCAAILPDVKGYETAHCGDDYNFVCERGPDCAPGRFGPNCEFECHCLGEPCISGRENTLCTWGCQPGWIGKACSKPKEKPEVRYFCINSPEKHIGRYVDVHIHTHGIYYRSIYALMANSTKQGPWCQGSRFSADREDSIHEHVSIKILMNDSIVDEMRSGNCAGTEVATNQFEWILVVQEFEGILLDTDIQVRISCNFDTSETLERSAKDKQSSSQHFSQTVNLTPETADVALNIVDPYSREVITEAPIGSHIALEMKFGFQEGSLVKGVRPLQCVATCRSGHQTKKLLEHYGCPAFGSPVSEFEKDKNSTNSISTPRFPLFAFAEHTEVVFKCSFNLCFHSDACDPGCHYYYRARRSADHIWPDFSSSEQEMEWTSGVIRILPDVLKPVRQAKTATAKSVHTGEKPKKFPKRYGLFRGAANPKHFKMEKTDSTPTTETSLLTTTTAATTTTTTATTIESRLQLEAETISVLSPITCGILLLMFLLVSAVFIAFHFNLRRTVNDMRHEMLRQRK